MSRYSIFIRRLCTPYTYIGTGFWGLAATTARENRPRPWLQALRRATVGTYDYVLFPVTMYKFNSGTAGEKQIVVNSLDSKYPVVMYLGTFEQTYSVVHIGVLPAVFFCQQAYGLQHARDDTYMYVHGMCGLYGYKALAWASS